MGVCGCQTVSWFASCEEGVDLTLLSDDSLLIVNRMVTKMSPLNRYFPLVGLETRLSKARPYCYVLLLVVFVWYMHI